MIREITSKDLQKWIELRCALWPMHTKDEIESECKSLIKIKNYKTWFYCNENGDVLGFIEATIKNSAVGCKTDKIGYIEAWYVLPEFQRQKIGPKLMNHAEKWAKSMSCKEMASDTTSEFPNSIIAHKSSGYEDCLNITHFSKKLKTI